MMARVTKAPLPDAVSIQPSAVNSANAQGRNCDEPAGSPRAGEPVARMHASPLDIGGQRTRDLQKWKKRRVAGRRRLLAWT